MFTCSLVTLYMLMLGTYRVHWYIHVHSASTVHMHAHTSMCMYMWVQVLYYDMYM